MIVVSILAVTAVVATGTFTGVHESAGGKIAHAEMQEVAGAIRRFKQDTGYYPGTGPFNLKPGGAIDVSMLPEHPGYPGSDAEWFREPWNFYQLLARESPLPHDDAHPDDPDANHLLARWNPETGRGWRGPYIVNGNSGSMTIGNPEISRVIYLVDGDDEPGDPRPLNGLAKPKLISRGANGGDDIVVYIE